MFFGIFCVVVLALLGVVFESFLEEIWHRYTVILQSYESLHRRCFPERK